MWGVMGKPGRQRALEERNAGPATATLELTPGPCHRDGHCHCTQSISARSQYGEAPKFAAQLPAGCLVALRGMELPRLRSVQFDRGEEAAVDTLTAAGASAADLAALALLKVGSWGTAMQDGDGWVLQSTGRGGSWTEGAGAEQGMGLHIAAHRLPRLCIACVCWGGCVGGGGGGRGRENREWQANREGTGAAGH
jgi:hypothetical protein